MPSRETNFAKRRPVRSQFIGDNNRGDKALAAKELAQKSHCRGLVAPGLYKNFQNLALTIDSAPRYICVPESETTISSRCHRV
jgi:hypothetical protein